MQTSTLHSDFKDCIGARMTSIVTSGKRIAIVGGGYAGLGTAYSLASSGAAQVIHLYDNFSPGNADASGISAGIMHPMATRGKVIWRGMEGMQQGMHFLDSAQKFSTEKVYDPSIKLYRFLFSTADLKYWSDAAQALPNLVSMRPLDSFMGDLHQEGNSDGMPLLGVAHIKQGTIVNSPAYLQALWRATVAATPASEWVPRRVGPEDLAHLSAEYDEVVLACGAGIPRLCGVDWPKNNKLSSLRLIRGHNLLFRQTSDEREREKAAGGRTAYLSGEYVIPSGPPRCAAEGDAGRGSYLLCGPTHDHVSVEDYERVYAAEGPLRSDLQAAESQLLDRLRQRYPSLAGRQPFAAIAGTRLVTQRGELGRLPIVGRLPGSSNVWIHGGFGSRGLILHALTANFLRDAIAAGDESRIPSHLGVLTTKLTAAEKPR